MFDIEQYFFATTIEDEARRVMTAITYLGRDAKLWWQTKSADIYSNRAQRDLGSFQEIDQTMVFPGECGISGLMGTTKTETYWIHLRLCEILLRTYARYLRHVRKRIFSSLSWKG
ncbi:Uncharacterized protein Adt_03326 [Abeliophyllum distichum]|uniref:Retrotransposon gag domain-containing protein n=1 Tax=Abeliophyllum distichum TaxID=126358 RepID=A0ABD1W0A3_9LAMI